MKRSVRNIFSLALAIVMLLSLAIPAHAATYDYAVEGGNLKFDPATGTIVDCDTSVYSVNIPSEIYGIPVTTIGKLAFCDCRMSSVEIPSSVTKIAENAFLRCKQLKSIVIPSSVTALGEQFGDSGMFKDCAALESITISGNIKRLPNYMFHSCKNLRSVVIEEGVEEVGKYCFFASGLESITFPDSLKSVEASAFEACNNLETVTFGSGIKNIANQAFRFYTTPKLKSLYFRGNAPSATNKIVNKFADGFMIYYPEGASGWTSPTWNGYITRPYTLSDTQPAPATPATTVTPAAPASPQPVSNPVTAVPTFSPVYVNGVQVQFDAYNIDKNNYFKLRDLAFILSGTKAQFNVEWKNAIAMTSGQPYTPVGGEMAAGSGVNQIAKPTSSAVLLDGSPLNLTAYNINGNNYFKLRDIGKLFDFDVHWDSTLQGVVIQPDAPYTDV